MTEAEVQLLFQKFLRCVRPLQQAFAFLEDSLEKSAKGEISEKEALAEIKHTVKVAKTELKKVETLAQTHSQKLDKKHS